MKIDGSQIAKNAMRKKENDQLSKEGTQTVNEVTQMGDHIKAMSSFIEAVHMKDPEAAHSHITAYAKHAAQSDKKEAL